MKAFQIVCSAVTGLAVASFGLLSVFVVPKFREIFDEIVEGDLPLITRLVVNPPLNPLLGSVMLAVLAAALVASVKPPWMAGFAALGFILLVTLALAVMMVALFLPLMQTLQAMN